MRLIDCFLELIVYVVLAVKSSGEAQPDFEILQENIDQLFEKSQQFKEKGNFSDQDYNYARMSVSVWIDEAILNSDWLHKRKWKSASSQRRYYNMADGGMEFFDRLDKIGHENRDVREVAYYCLALGLTGRYVEKGDKAVLDHLKVSNLKRLFSNSTGKLTLENRRLFPEAYPKQAFSQASQNRSFSRRALPFAIGLFSIGLFFALLAMYYYLLKMDLDKFV